MANTNRPLTEPAMVVETFVTGMLRPETKGGIVRLVFYADRPTGEDEDRIVVVRMTMERQVFLEIARDMLNAMGAPT